MRRFVATAVGALLAFTLSSTAPASAQEYPTRTVTIVVPYPAGGPTDQLARLLAPKLTETLGQNFIVENVSGGATTIATGRVARAAPDGHTLLLHNLQISANVSLHPNLPFDTEKDLTPVAFINHNPLVLVGRKSLTASTFPELIAWMKTTPARIAHPGTGSTGHLTTALFAQEANVTVNQIPYRGSAPALQDLAGGHIDLNFATPQAVVQQVSAGQIKAYGITSAAPVPQFPGVPSLAQLLGPKLEISYWHALFAPAGTARPLIEKLNRSLQSVMDDPAVLSAWAETGVSPYPKAQRSPEAAQAMLHSEINRWGEVVRANNIQAATE
ncbi:MAG: Bug family tripartite tricarboxylate transporter substrate binding protein [Xanthobacteraceae bacterium]